MDKNELIKSLANINYCPPSELVKMNINLEKAQKFSIDKAAALGTAFQPLAQLANLAAGGAGQSGLYFVNTSGKKMFKSGGQYIGTLQAADGGVGGGLAKMTQIKLDPTMLCMAVALMSVEKKLDAIYEAQKEILNFLELKEEAKLKGNINALYEVLSNYKYNWDNEKYKNNKHILVQDIKRDAEQSIILYRERLDKQLRKHTLLSNNKKVNTILNEIISRLNDYQLALYTFSFSTFLEVMLLENFDSGYLNGISDKILEYLSNYNEFYGQCAEKIQSLSESSIEGRALKGLSTVSSGAGKIVGKIPGINKSNLNENLIKAGDKLIDVHTNRVKNLAQLFADTQKDYVSIFVQNIKTIDELYNRPMQVMFDEKNIYLTEAC